MTIAAQTHITETLRSIPKDARMIYEYHAFASRSIPIGSIAKEALAHIDAQAAEIERLKAQQARKPHTEAEVQEIILQDDPIRDTVTVSRFAYIDAIDRLDARAHTEAEVQEIMRSETAWHDAPTEPGLWLFAGNLMGKMYEWRVVRIQDASNPDKEHGRWYGPIPEDKP